MYCVGDLLVRLTSSITGMHVIVFAMSVYYSPADHGLEIFGELEQDDLCYQFNMLVVWKRAADGDLLWAMDSG